MPIAKKLRKEVTGTCNVDHVSPQNAPSEGPGSVYNLKLSFEEALKLHLALDEAVHRVNRYDRSTKEGKNAGVQLTIYLGKGRINVTEADLRKKD